MEAAPGPFHRPASDTSRWIAAMSRALDVGVRSTSVVHGGDVARSFRVELDDGRTVFAKTHADPPPGFFSTEAAGLSWLAAAGALRLPEVIALSDATTDAAGFLVLEWIDAGRPYRRTDADFGSALALLHAAGAPCFGREDGRTTGSLALPNDPCDSWVEFLATRRLLPLLDIAASGGALPEPSLALIERVVERLDRLGGPVERPARLHGDLWAGNRLVDADGASWLIDPAAHGGHREFDLAMMRLFGGFGDDCFAAYEDAYPLADGHAERVALHQLSPLIVHAIKFGGDYVAATHRALAASLAIG
ncbi:MAG: fructosamine kinase family protein [Ilumatobacteraceae bacterium]